MKKSRIPRLTWQKFRIINLLCLLAIIVYIILTLQKYPIDPQDISNVAILIFFALILTLINRRLEKRDKKVEASTDTELEDLKN